MAPTTTKMTSSLSNGVSYAESTSLVTKEIQEVTQDKQKPKIASSGRKAAVMASCLVLQMVATGVGYGLGVMYVEIMRVFRVDRTDAALIQSLYMGIMTGAGVLWGPVIERRGPGPCVVIGAFIATIGLFTSGFATSHVMVVICTGVVASIGMCTCYLSSFITVGWTFHDNPALPLIILTTGSSVGQFVVPFLYEIFISMYGWSGAFILISGIALQTLPCGVLICCSREFYSDGSETNTHKSTPRRCDVTILRDPIVILMLINCLLIASTGNIENWFIVDIMMIRGFERQTGSMMVSIIGIANFFGRATGGLLRLKTRWPTIYHWVYILPVIAACHVIFTNVYSYWPLIVACIPYGVAFGITVAQVPAIILEATSLQRYAQAMSFVNLMYGSGNLICGLVGGYVKDSLGSYDAFFYFSAGSSVYISIAAFGVAQLIKRKNAALLPDTISIPYDKLPQ